MLLLPFASGPIKLPAVKLPVVFNVPATFTPVPVIVIILALPIALNVILPFAVAIFMLLLPFASGPIKLAAVTFPPELILPAIPTPPSTTTVPVLVLVLGVGDPAEKVIEPDVVHI